MTDRPDLFATFSDLFRQIAATPQELPTLPLGKWPDGSQEQRLLGDFQDALVSLTAWGNALEEKERLPRKLYDAGLVGGRAQEREEMLAREQATLLEISQTLASGLELRPGLILDQLRIIIEYTHASLFALEGTVLTTLAVRAPHPLAADITIPLLLEGPQTLAPLLNQHLPVRIADIRNSDSAAQSLLPFADQFLAGVCAWMWVPLVVKGRLIGGMGIGHTEPDFFTEHHADLALIVANQAAIMMVNAELYQQAQALAALEERQHLARNLHDAVNQSLFSAGLIAEVLPRLWERDQEQARHSLEDLRKLMRGAMAEMRALLVELRFSALIDAELSELLHLLANALIGRTNIPVTVSVGGQGALQEQGKIPAEVQVAFYRVCQEGLNNIAKHAGATEVAIHLHFEADTVELRLWDNGRGFDLKDVPSGHYGLEMMRERAEAVGALLLVKSQPDEGTEIVTRWMKNLEQISHDD